MRACSNKRSVVLAMVILSSCGGMLHSQEVFEFSEADFEIIGELGEFTPQLSLNKIENGLAVLTIAISADQSAEPPEFTIRWKVPSVEIAGVWSPRISLDKASYWVSFTSRAARYAPVISYFDSSDMNRITVACSDALRSIDVRSYIKEEDAHLYTQMTFFKEKSPAIDSYSAEILIDTRTHSLVAALHNVADWWAGKSNYTPAHVPDLARRPMYSTWYSFHQNITADEVVEQCRLSKDLGFEAVIVDDGWQTLDSSRGYAYTGDWQPVRIGDMKEFVERVHALDMKFLLWYSVALVGEMSAVYDELKGKYLWYWQGQGSYVLDPRFPEVREYVINTYESALRDWNLDGFKLDFIGMFRPDEKTIFEATDGRDYASIDEAVDRLMTDIMVRLRAIKPDIMIEFRQPYIGPLMRKYGNMFRATDCPNMGLVNRVRTADVRLLCGDTAVHSDMFMWHYDDSVESAALQILNILFSVPQLSVKLDEIPADHKRMVTFWIDYWNENRDILLGENFTPVNPSANYPLIMAYDDKKLIAALYNDYSLDLRGKSLTAIDIVNAKVSEQVIVLFDPEVESVHYKAFDCTGNLVAEQDVTIGNEATLFTVPRSGLLQITITK